MRRVRVDRLSRQEVLAEDLFDLSGRPVLRRGTRLGPEHAQRLNRLGIAQLLVEDPLTPELVIEPLLGPATLARVVPGVADLYARAAAAPAGSLPRFGLHEVRPLASALVDDVAAAGARRFEWVPLLGGDYLVAHALNVAVLAAMLGLRLGLRPPDRVVDLAAAGLLLDLGMARIPKEVRHRPGPLSEAEWAAVRAHPDVAAGMLDHSVSAHTAAAVAQHHERLDGSGYPQGLSGDQITPLARVLAVADVFLAVQEERAYRPRLMPHEALELLLSEAGGRLAMEPVRALTQVVNVYPLGVRVRLSSGRTGIVVGHSGVASRPVVRCLPDDGGSPEDVDLAAPQHQTEFVVELLYD